MPKIKNCIKYKPKKSKQDLTVEQRVEIKYQ